MAPKVIKNLMSSYTILWIIMIIWPKIFVFLSYSSVFKLKAKMQNDSFI